MENNTVKIFACALALAGMSACSYDSERFGNEAYIAAPEFRQEVKVKVDENVKEMEAVITVAAPRPVEKQMEVTLCSAPELLETYKLAYYDDDVELLPEQNYELGDGKTVFYEGMAEADPFNVKFTNLDKLQYREGSGENEVKKKYILPVRLESAGELPLLESARTMYYVVSEASLINVVADIHDNRAWPVWKNPAPFKDMSAFTMEALVWNDGFTNKEISTVMGIEDRFLVRIGDATLKKNQLNIALAEPVPGSVNRLHLTNDKGMLLKAGRWYHIAVTFDNGIVKAYVNGKEQPEILDATEINVNSVDFTTGVFTGANGMPDEDHGNDRAFWIGYSYNSERSLVGRISEVRFWNRALTDAEINAENHFYKLYLTPQIPEGLIGYWKFDQGQGQTVADCSGNGNDLRIEKVPVWYKVALP